MKRADLEHLIRAAAAITNEHEIVVIGSQSLLGSVPAPPSTLTQSMEADLYPKSRPELADVIDGAIGEDSPFHELFGYYAQGVGPDTAKLPRGWQERLVPIQNANTDLKIGLCLEPHDLAAAKLAAGREKDWVFVREMLSWQIVKPGVLLERIDQLPIEKEHQQRLHAWVGAQGVQKPPPSREGSR